jgi:predicted ATPase
MCLRYFHIREYPPLQNVEIVFSADSPLKTQNAIHFVVGVNGSGKTHLLQALTEIFLCLEQKRRPPFPVTLVYELGSNDGHSNKKQTFIFDNPAGKTPIGWWHSAPAFFMPPEADASHFQNIVRHVRQSPNSGWKAIINETGGWSGEGSTFGLPKAVLAYTTGIADPWENLFRQHAQAGDISTDTNDDNPPEERPVHWTQQQEQAYQHELEGTKPPQTPIIEVAETDTSLQDICQFITPFMLKLAVLAVTLPQALDDFKQHDTDAKKQAFIQQIRDKQQLQGLSALLAQVGWVWPVSLIFEFNFKPENFAHTNRQGNFWANALFKLAVAVIREPEPSTKRRAIIDLGRVEAQDLKELIDVSESPFSVFQRLVVLHRMGLLDNLQLGVRKTDPDDILLFDELSDGEQMYLGRMALFHLLQGQDDALLLLDEPETHFNDFWKREMVGIIDDVLKDHACNVIISTHSSITLTDVFDHEIIRFQKENGESRVVPLTSTTFGADPSEIMISVFGAEDSIGERSLAWLNAQLERQWKPEEREELERIIKQIGPGLHRSELRTIWRKLSAAQN